ncbi:hypothetical protein Tco_0132664 [Tanacetum coccineum]
MTWFEQLETHLHDLYLLNSPYAVDAFKPAFRSFFGEEHQTFKLKMFHNLDQLRLQLERENLHGVNAKTCLQALRTQFKEFLASKGVNATDLLNQGWQQDFEDFTRCEPSAYRRELLENLDTLEAVIHRVVNTYGVLRMKENELNALKENGSQLHDEILHEHQIKSSVKMQSQDIQINPVQAMDDSLIVSKSSLIEPENNNAFSKSEIETQMQRQEEKVDMREAVDAGLVVTESSGTKPDKQDTSSSSGNYTTQAVDADIGPVNDEEPFAEVQLTALHNILANEQQHTEQSEPNYDTHLLETIDSNTTPTSTNMCHRGGEIDQDALLNAELLKTKDMVCMEVYNELSKRFLQLEKHCISLEISIQQKEESFHSNKPCKNKEYPEFREFFVINDLKAQLQAKTTLICDLKNQIKSVKEASNEAKVKNDIDVIETINIELEHSVAKLLAANEQLHKEKEHLKQTYKELYDTIKKTRVQNKDNSDSLISQINQKSVENADLKAQIQEKVFANAALKNELRKLKGNIVDSKFAKASILGKPPLQPSRNHLVVRQPNAFTESAAAKPHQVNAPNYSRNSHKESYGSNDMVHAYFLEDARKMTQDKTRIPNHRDMASTRAHCTPNACTPKPRNIYRSSPVFKCSGGISNGVPLFSPSRSETIILEPKNHTHKPGRQNGIGQRFSLNKSSAVHEKPHTPRSCLRWKPTGRIFKTVHLRWIPTGKVFIDSTTNVDSKPPNGSNDDITNPYECIQTLYVSAGTSNSSAEITPDGQPCPLTRLSLELGKSNQLTERKGFLMSPQSSLLPQVKELAPSQGFLMRKANLYISSLSRNLSLQLSPPTIHIQQSSSVLEMVSHGSCCQISSGPAPSLMTPGYISSGLYYNLPPRTVSPDPVAIVASRAVDPVGSPSFNPDPTIEDTSITQAELYPSVNPVAGEPSLLKKQDSTYSIRSTNKVALEEYDLKSALFKHMNKNKTANRNPANYHLYHAQMEALIADEDVMDKEVTVKVKDHKRKHDDDDEGPSAGSNQGRSEKRRRPESAASGSAQPPPKNDDQSSKKPRKYSFIVSKKRSSDSSKKLKGIQTLNPAEQEAADIMKALKESKKMSKR